MTNKAENPQLDAAVIEARGKVETFFEKHGKSILWGLFIVACACVIYFIWSSRSERNSRIAEQNASVALVAAYDAIGIGDYETAAAEAVKVASEYEGTDAANLASYIAGASYVKLGQWDDARSYLNGYEPAEGAAGELLNAMRLGLLGDIAVEQDDLQGALDYFAKAAAASSDPVSEPMFLRKQAEVYAAMGDDAKAAECYAAIARKYPAQASSVEKYRK